MGRLLPLGWVALYKKVPTLSEKYTLFQETAHASKIFSVPIIWFQGATRPELKGHKTKLENKIKNPACITLICLLSYKIPSNEYKINPVDWT